MKVAKLWIVGFCPLGSPWEFIGVYDTEQAATDSCVDGDYFVCPLFLNKSLLEGQFWPGVTYPKYDPDTYE